MSNVDREIRALNVALHPTVLQDQFGSLPSPVDRQIVMEHCWKTGLSKFPNRHCRVLYKIPKWSGLDCRLLTCVLNQTMWMSQSIQIWISWTGELNWWTELHVSNVHLSGVESLCSRHWIPNVSQQSVLIQKRHWWVGGTHTHHPHTSQPRQPRGGRSVSLAHSLFDLFNSLPH